MGAFSAMHSNYRIERSNHLFLTTKKEFFNGHTQSPIQSIDIIFKIIIKKINKFI